MTKQNFKLIATVLDGKAAKVELRYAEIDFNAKEIKATDTRVAVRFKLDDSEIERCYGKKYIHKEVLNVLAKVAEKDFEYIFIDNMIIVGGVAITLLGAEAYGEDFEYPDYKMFEGFKADIEYIPKSIDYIDFDTVHNNAHIPSTRFLPLQSYGIADTYKVEVVPQTEKEGSIGLVRVSAYNILDENELQQRYEYLLAGVPYKAPEKTLFD